MSKNNFLKMLTTAKTRTLVILGGGIIISGVLIALVMSGDSSDKFKESQSNTSKIPSSIASTPGEKTSEKYKELQQLANEQGSQEARKQNKTFIPTIVSSENTNSKTSDNNNDDSNNDQQSTSDLLSAFNRDKEQKEKESTNLKEKDQKNTQLQALLARQRQQEADEANLRKRGQNKRRQEQLLALQEQRIKAIEEVSKAMESQANSLISGSGWFNPPAQNYVSGPLSVANRQEQEESNNNDNSNNNSQRPRAPVIYKAGTIIFAVLETSINSDEPGPIMAKIVSGDLRGGRVLGTMTVPASGEKIQLTFNTLNLPQASQSYSFTGVAIDPETARTALASDVDHHYLTKWGAIFASSFIEGYSKAVGKTGTSTTTQNQDGSVVTSTNNSNLNGRQQFFEGIAKVGEAWGDGISEYKNIKPTVTIDSGVGIGILLTADMRLEEDAPVNNQPFANNNAPSTQNSPTKISSSNDIANNIVNNSVEDNNALSAITAINNNSNSGGQ